MPQGLDISERNPRIRNLQGFGGLLVTAVLVGGAVVLVYALRALPHLFSFLDRTVPNKADAGALCATLAVAVGAALYLLRLRMRWLYAAVELCFGFATAWVSVARGLHAGDELGAWFGFVGAAYLIVRGLDNFAVAKTQGGWPWRKMFDALTGLSRVRGRR